MTKAAISRIREAEERAAAIRDSAERTARERIEQNERACAAYAARATDATAAELRARLDTVRQKADALIEQSRQAAAADAEALETEARTRMRDAVKLIVWEMYDSCQ